MKKYLLILSALCIAGVCATAALAANSPVSPSMQQIVNTFLNLGGTKPMAGDINMGGNNITNSPGYTNMSGLAAQTATFSHSNQPIKMSFFGTHYAYPRFSNDTTQTPYFANTAGSVRTWDTFGQHLTWKEIETSEGVYDWSNLDAYITWALANDMEVTFTLGQPPSWACTDGDNNPGTDYNYNTPDPAHPKYWEDFCTALATRYKGEISSYEIWNEPPGYYLGTASQLAYLTQEASVAIKAVDPAAKIVSASCTGSENILWFDSYFSALQSIDALSSIDIVGYHLYVSGPPENMVDLAQQVRSLMFKYGVGNLPLWDTETTWNSYVDAVTGSGVAGGPSGPATPMPSKQQAGYLTRMFLSGAAAGCDKVFLYGMDHDWSAIQPADLAHPSNLTQTGQALRKLVSWAVGKRIVSYVHDKVNGIFTLTAKDSSGIPSSWVWTEDAKPQTITLNAEKGTGSFTNWSGVTSFAPMTSVSIPINYAPKLFTGYNPQCAGDDFTYTTSATTLTTAPPFDNLAGLNVAGGVTYISAGTTPIIGGEINPDPYFATPGDWGSSGGSGWTVAGDGTAVVSHSGSTSSLYPVPHFYTVSGQTYQVTITISAIANGTGIYALMYSASGSQYITTHYAIGTYTDTFTANKVEEVMISCPGSNPSATITYFSMKPVSYSAVSLAQSTGFTYDPTGKILTVPYICTGRGDNVASASTITPTGQLFHVTGTTTINTINLPTAMWNGKITIIPDGVFSTGTSGNIANAVTSVVNTPLDCVYDTGQAKWFIK
jgi:Glycosyl hydrolase family 10